MVSCMISTKSTLCLFENSDTHIFLYLRLQLSLLFAVQAVLWNGPFSPFTECHHYISHLFFSCVNAKTNPFISQRAMMSTFPSSTTCIIKHQSQSSSVGNLFFSLLTKPPSNMSSVCQGQLSLDNFTTLRSCQWTQCQKVCMLMLVEFDHE